MRKAVSNVVLFGLLIALFGLLLYEGPVHGASYSGGTDCATSQTAGVEHIAVDWPTGQQNPTDTFAGTAPSEDMFGVLSCGDGRHVEWQWIAGSPKAAFTWGN